MDALRNEQGTSGTRDDNDISDNDISDRVEYETARTPEDLTRLFVEFSNAGNADAVASLYDDDAVMAYPPGQVTRGREAIRRLWASVLEHRPTFAPEPPLPTLMFGDGLALTATPPRDGAGARAQVVTRRPDGSWVRIIDQPEFVSPSG